MLQTVNAVSDRLPIVILECHHLRAVCQTKCSIKRSPKTVIRSGRIYSDNLDPELTVVGVRGNHFPIASTSKSLPIRLQYRC